jgi:hypothetical protein
VRLRARGRTGLGNIHSSAVPSLAISSHFLRQRPSCCSNCGVSQATLCCWAAQVEVSIYKRSSAAQVPKYRLPFITGHGDVPMTVKAMKAGAVDFLPKPFRQQETLDAVAGALERDRKRRSEEKSGWTHGLRSPR